MQSFSYKAKAELCRGTVQRLCCARAECYGALLYCNTFTMQEVRIITENPEFAARLPRLFQRAFNVKFDRLPSDDLPGGKLIFQITEPEKLRRILDTLGYDPRQSLVLHVNFALLEDDCCRTAFLRGAFLAGGSVTDPEKRYHLELSTTHLKVIRETDTLMQEMGLAPKQTERKGSGVLYYKQSDSIEDFLTCIGAPVSAMAVMQAKIEKDWRNEANRKTNCDTANVTKAVDAAQQQLAALRRLEERGVLDTLSEKLRETALLRQAHPEATLSELAELHDPPTTKSTVNHRMRKLLTLAEE